MRLVKGVVGMAALLVLTSTVYADAKENAQPVKAAQETLKQDAPANADAALAVKKEAVVKPKAKKKSKGLRKKRVAHKHNETHMHDADESQHGYHMHHAHGHHQAHGRPHSHAMHKAHDISVLINAGSLFLDSSRTSVSRHRMIYGASFVYNFCPVWSADITAGTFKTRSKVTLERLSGFNFAVNGVYHFNTKGRMLPFLTAGVGAFNFDSPNNSNKTDLTLNAGLGAKLYMHKHWLVRADVRQNFVQTGGRSHQDIIANFGVGWHFQGAHSHN